MLKLWTTKNFARSVHVCGERYRPAGSRVARRGKCYANYSSDLVAATLVGTTASAPVALVEFSAWRYYGPNSALQAGIFRRRPPPLECRSWAIKTRVCHVAALSHRLAGTVQNYEVRRVNQCDMCNIEKALPA